MEKNNTTVFNLSKSQISTQDIVSYLETLDMANLQIMKVLLKKPILPEYEKLSWVIESKTDKIITGKLKNNKNLNLVETSRLKEILSSALKQLKNSNKNGLQSYLKQLD